MARVEATATARLDGLDLARLAAFVGMVLVNFKIVMGAEGSGGPLTLAMGSLEGKAAATFVVLAGLGLGLAAHRGGYSRTLATTLKRAVFLIVVGLLNSLIFDADILHYYAIYFLIGVFCVTLPSSRLAALVVLVNAVFVAMVVLLDYDAGWNWNDYSYADFWTPAGFVRNLFFNGWHPVFPWLGFLLIGLIFSRFRLSEAQTQHRLILAGLAGLAAAGLVSMVLAGPARAIDPQLPVLLTTSPIPPMPLYVISGTSAAAAVIGICLRAAAWLERSGMLVLLLPAGRQTLTLYIAHIVIGMGLLEAAGLTGGQSLAGAVAAALLFCLAAVIYAYFWSKVFKRGPVEALMRKLAG